MSAAQRHFPSNKGPAAPYQNGSQVKTSEDRSSGYMEGRNAGNTVFIQPSGVQPSDVCAVRNGRGCVNKTISLFRTPKIWPVTSAAASLIRDTVNGAIFSA